MIDTRDLLNHLRPVELVGIVLRQLRADEASFSLRSLDWQVRLITDVLVDGQNRQHAWQQECDTKDEPNEARRLQRLLLKVAGAQFQPGEPPPRGHRATCQKHGVSRRAVITLTMRQHEKRDREYEDPAE